jgi:hypothetical protein
MKQAKKCPQCGTDLVVAFDEYSGLTWLMCPEGREKHYASLEFNETCPDCGGRIILDGTEHICTACGRVSGSEHFDTSLPYLRDQGEDKGIELTELVLGHGDLTKRGGKDDLAGKPGTPDFDNDNLGTWTSNKQIRAALGLATRLNEKGQFEILLGEEEKRAYAEQIKRGGRVAIIPKGMWNAGRFNRDLVYIGGERLDPRKHLIILGRERYEDYVRRAGRGMAAHIPRSMRGAKERIMRHEVVCQNRLCQAIFVTQDRRIKYCSKRCRLAEQSARHRESQRDYVGKSRRGKG